MFKRIDRQDPILIGKNHDWNLNSHTNEWSALNVTVGEMDTTNHPNWRRQDDAGSFWYNYARKIRRTPSSAISIRNVNSILTYDGQLTAKATFPDWAPIRYGDTFGAQAWNLMKPAKPMLNLFNPLYELKDLPRMLDDLATRSGNLLKDIGDGFIGQLFGWMPLVGDVANVINHQQKLQKRIDWLLRNQGKWVPGKCELVRNASEWGYDWYNDWGAFEQTFTNSFYYSQPQTKTTFRGIDHCWAVAQFRYFLPEPPLGVTLNDVVKRFLQGNRSITLGNLYRAIPWSWMIDWAFKASATLDALDDGIAERLAARRFFIMRENTWWSTNEVRGTFRGLNNESVTATATTQYFTSSKTRVRGSPFYPPFGGPPSDMQAAILGALGMSKYL